MEGVLVKSYLSVLCLVGAVAAPVTAQPRIVPEAGLKRSRSGLLYDVGEVHEREQTFVRHTFTLRNTGFEQLHITEVRAGCHCTVVEFDSIVPPGGEGALLQEVDLYGFRSGPFVRTIEIRSNARGTPRLKLGIRGILRTFVETDRQFLRIRDGVPPGSNTPLQVRSRKADLRVEEVVFQPLGGGATPWRPDIPVWLLHQVERGEETDENGYIVHTLKLGVALSIAEPMRGVFLIRTNHPRKPQTGVRGVIDKS